MKILHYEGYDIKPHKETPTCYVIVTSGKGGKIPHVLEGLFTSPIVAKTLIDTYLESKAPKE